MRRLLLLFGVALIPFGLYAQTVRWIAPNGNDTTGTGTSINPVRSLHKALTLAISGDTCRFTAGNFREDRECLVPVNIHIRGSDSSTTVIYSSFKYKRSPGSPYHGILTLSSATPNTPGNQVISDLAFDGMNYTGTLAIAVQRRSNVTVNKCVFKNFYLGAVTFYGEFFNEIYKEPVYCIDNKFLNSRILNCSTYGTYLHGLTLYGQDSFEVGDSKIENLRGGGVSNDCIGSGYCKRFYIHDNIFRRSNYVYPYWNFALELRWNFGECRLIDNRIQSQVDLCWNYKQGYDYSWLVQGNTFGFPALQAVFNQGISIEADTYSLIIKENTIQNTAAGITTAAGFAGHATCTDGLTIQNNLITNIGMIDAPDWYQSGLYRMGISIDKGYSNNITQNVYIYNNTITGGVGSVDAIRLGGTGISKFFFIKNNILTDFNHAGIECALSPGNNKTVSIDSLVIQYNDFYGNGNGNAIRYTNISPRHQFISNNLKVDPVFISSSDFHLQPRSPLIDAGVDVGLPFLYEAPDMGAYEYTDR